MAVIDIIPALLDNYFIKAIFLVHAALVSLANITNYSNSSIVTYVSYNFTFLICVLLAILVEKNTDMVLVGAAFNVICIALDIVLVITSNNVGTVAILIIVLNLILRPVSTILLLKNYSARAGVEDPTSGMLEVNVPNVPRARSAYQNIDEPSQTLP